jgi:hypothetical protein
MDNPHVYKPDKKFFKCGLCRREYEYEFVTPNEIEIIKGYKPIYACDICARILLASMVLHGGHLSDEVRETYFPDLEKEDKDE